MTMNEFQKLGRVARSNYDRLSRWYDYLAAGSEWRAQAAGLELLRLHEGDTVLEIGSGTGQALLVVARSVGNSGKVFGIDLSWGMIAKAADKLEKASLSERSSLLRGDAVHLPFQGDFCDAILMSFTLELFHPGDMSRVLSECQRVLRESGSLCVVALAEKEDPGPMSRMYGWAHRNFPEWLDCRPIDVQSVVSQAGLQIQDMIEMGMWGLPIQILLAEKS
jgi:demethylmenaquinone methyltransferase/2-methoxy-6-polyprenyl-1,4-benzoquinol methylase